MVRSGLTALEARFVTSSKVYILSSTDRKSVPWVNDNHPIYIINDNCLGHLKLTDKDVGALN